MNFMRVMRWLGVVVLPCLLLLTSLVFTDPDPTEGSELHGLHQAPDIQVASIILREDSPDQGEALRPQSAQGCDKDIDLNSTISGVVAVAVQDNTICTSADLDVYKTDTKTYVVQAGGKEAAWIHTDVTNPHSPVMLGPFKWPAPGGVYTYTRDVKAFRQGAKNYIALSLERLTPSGLCGVVIVDVSNPENPVVVTQIHDSDPDDSWCDVHNTFVEDDAGGQGRYIYLTADLPRDIRVLDIGGLAGVTVTPVCDIAVGTCAITEIGRYRSPTAGDDNFVHDITVLDHGGTVRRRAYLSYWDSGLVILNAADLTPAIATSTNPTPIVGPNLIDPGGFLVHHAWANQGGDRVFIQDEFLGTVGDEPIQMWEFSNPASPTYVDGLVLGTDVPVNPAHNLEVRFDIDPNRLYVAWYRLGLQAFDFTGTGFTGRALFHQVQTEIDDDVSDGAWTVRTEYIGGYLYIFQSDRRYGLIIDCVSCPLPALIPGVTQGGLIALAVLMTIATVWRLRNTGRARTGGSLDRIQLEPGGARLEETAEDVGLLSHGASARQH